MLQEVVLKKRMILFVSLEAIIYIGFLLMDFTNIGGSSFLKYAGILLCLVFTLLCDRTEDSLLIFTAFLFTAFADLFLLLLDRWYAAGILLFCIVQLIYAKRFFAWKKQGSPAQWLLRFVLPVSCFLLLAVFNSLTLLTGAAAFYGINLVINAVISVSFFHTGVSHRLFSIGLWLFLCCDLCVAIHNLNFGIYTLQVFADYGMWLFYLPSQVLIALSCCSFLPRRNL